MASKMKELANKIVWGYIRKKAHKKLHIPEAIKEECLRFLAWDFIESSILCSDEEKERLFEILSSQSVHSNIVSGFKLLYRASIDGFGVSTYRHKCREYDNLVVIIKSKKNHIFGAYTSNKLCFESPVSQWIKDEKCFLFFLKATFDDNTKVYPIDEDEADYAIRSTPMNGPSFGGGFDLFISNNCNVKKDSYCMVHGDTFNIDDAVKFCGSNDNWRSKIKYTFLVKDYEVFQLSS